MHWPDGSNSIGFTYSVETQAQTSIKLDTCILGSSNLPETTNIHEDKTTVLKTPTMRAKHMKNVLITEIKRWVKATVIAVSIGVSVGSPSLQSNAL